MTRSLLCAAALITASVGAQASAQDVRDSLEGSTITCNSWSGRHSVDPKIDWDDVSKDAPVVVAFGRDGGRVVSFPNAAFKAGIYPASVSDAQPGMTLFSMGERIVLQSLSASVADTVTIDGVKNGEFYAVWQRFRFDGERTRAIVLQGACSRS